MNLSKDIFRQYFQGNMKKEELCSLVGITEDGFEEYLKKHFLKSYQEKDSEMAEYMIYILFVGENVISLSNFCDVLNELLISTWHTKHEDIATLLQWIKRTESVEYLVKAIDLKPQYLDYDANCAYEVKCLWALYTIGNEDAILALKKLSQHSNTIISNKANELLSRKN